MAMFNQRFKVPPMPMPAAPGARRTEPITVRQVVVPQFKTNPRAQRMIATFNQVDRQLDVVKRARKK